MIKKYKVKYTDNTGEYCIDAYNTKEDAENAIEEELDGIVIE